MWKSSFSATTTINLFLLVLGISKECTSAQNLSKAKLDIIYLILLSAFSQPEKILVILFFRSSLLSLRKNAYLLKTIVFLVYLII